MSEKITWDKAGYIMGAAASNVKVQGLPKSIRNASPRSFARRGRR